MTLTVIVSVFITSMKSIMLVGSFADQAAVSGRAVVTKRAVSEAGGRYLGRLENLRYLN